MATENQKNQKSSSRSPRQEHHPGDKDVTENQKNQNPAHQALITEEE